MAFDFSILEGEDAEMAPKCQDSLSSSTESLLSLPNVVGVAESESTVTLYLRSPQTSTSLPAEVNGKAVRTIVTGEIAAQ